MSTSYGELYKDRIQCYAQRLAIRLEDEKRSLTKEARDEVGLSVTTTSRVAKTGAPGLVADGEADAVRRKVREILVSSGAPVSDAAVRQLPKVPQSFPAFFRHKMDSWMKGFRQRNEKTSGCSRDSSKNFESDGEDAAD